ncbi:hypothetical protein ACFL7M_16550 [Thermodesulfobacteriota bacterium]
MKDKRVRDFRVFRLYGIIPLTMILFLFFTPAPMIHAHKVYLFAWTEGDTVYTESYLSGKKKVKDALIKVFDQSGIELLKGKTNQKGEFSFKIPKNTDMLIVLESSPGHRAEYILKTDELPVPLTMREHKTEDTEHDTSSPSEVSINMEQIRKMIEEALDSRLRPISRRLARIQQERGPGLTEIIGGIGYIFGIIGIILYYRARRK